ncbi:hypothetical protein FRB93_000434 [Tulasnella sp. JGI-2019a]|nr:hypothetical protein FRB93_000434 [Tulasnella sp. JGI-2019a]
MFTHCVSRAIPVLLLLCPVVLARPIPSTLIRRMWEQVVEDPLAHTLSAMEHDTHLNAALDVIPPIPEHVHQPDLHLINPQAAHVVHQPNLHINPPVAHVDQPLAVHPANLQAPVPVHVVQPPAVHPANLQAPVPANHLAPDDFSVIYDLYGNPMPNQGDLHETLAVAQEAIHPDYASGPPSPAHSPDVAPAPHEGGTPAGNQWNFIDESNNYGPVGGHAPVPAAHPALAGGHAAPVGGHAPLAGHQPPIAGHANVNPVPPHNVPGPRADAGGRSGGVGPMRGHQGVDMNVNNNNNNAGARGPYDIRTPQQKAGYIQWADEWAARYRQDNPGATEVQVAKATAKAAGIRFNLSSDTMEGILANREKWLAKAREG